MKTDIKDIVVGDWIYSKRSKGWADVQFIASWGFKLYWNYDLSIVDRTDHSANYDWSMWIGNIPEDFLICENENERLSIILKYS